MEIELNGIKCVATEAAARDFIIGRITGQQTYDPRVKPGLGEYSHELGGIIAGQSRDKDGRVFEFAVAMGRAQKPIILEDREWGERGKEIEGCTHYSDGRANTAAMAAAGNELAKDVLALGEGCYLGAIGELNIVRANLPDLLPKKWFWSSTQDGAYYARYQGFEGGFSDWGSKDDGNSVFVLRRVYR